MSTLEVGIIGNPNSGKTTLFNALTGEKQHVGNWPGVTVEKTVGSFYHHTDVKVVDLPGIYSLMVASPELSLDERIAADYIASGEADIILNVIDASNLERNLYLTVQLLEMGAPVVIALNMMDIVRKRGQHIDIDQLSCYLNCPVLPVEAVKKIGLDALKTSILHHRQKPLSHALLFAYPSALERAVDKIILALPNTTDDRSKKRHDAFSLIEGDYLARAQQSADVLAIVERAQQDVLEKLHVDADIIIADARYAFIGDIIQKVIRHQRKQEAGIGSWLDKIVLNRFLGLPIFCLMMYAMFSFAITIGGAFQDFFDLASQAIFVNAPTYFLQKIHSPSWLIVFIAQGLGKGINTVMTFIPVICGMFLALSFLEQSGYMARAAFVVDRVMRFIGLPGKSFVPMIVGFGCNVPAVLATRTLESQRDRVLTVMMSPFMSCGARLAIFAVFTAAFFPEGGATIVFSLYMIGIFIAIMTGFILRKTLLKGPSAPFILELPSYHMPSWRSLRLHTWHRLHGFVFKAGILIIPICMLLSVLDTLTIDQNSVSVLAMFGQWVTPIFSPMGVTTENWPATVGLLTGLLAKEVVVGTLNSLYGDSSSITTMLTYSSLQLGPELWEALKTIPDNLMTIIQSLLNPFSLSIAEDGLDSNVMGQMYQRFGGAVPAFAYLLFVLLYFPCVSTTAAIAREIGKGWALFSIVWTTFIAYGVAVFFYQSMTLGEHIMTSVIWMISILGVYVVTFVLLKQYSPKHNSSISSKTESPCHSFRKHRRSLCSKH